MVVIVSAQGKTTDRLIEEAKSLSNNPSKRELDVLLSSGEQISMSKLAILLNELKLPAISLTGWQAGIKTNNTNQDAIIESIDTSRIEKELDLGKIVIIAGFQGINKNMDITTLGRGGSDTTAVAVAAQLKAIKCLIFSDVDGVYTTDPRQTNMAKKLDEISYSEMIDIANEGAKVLHNRCVEIGERFEIPIVAKSTFNDNAGTVINNKIEGGYVKNIVKNDNVTRLCIIGHGILSNKSIFNKTMQIVGKHKLDIISMEVNESKIAIVFKQLISNEILEEFHKELL